jgi:hypothetical protein
MGYSSGGEIFDKIARALIEAGADDELLGRVLYELAEELTAQDWDTVDESIDEFAGHPVVQHALRKANGMQYLYGPDDRAQGYLQFVGDSTNGGWELHLDGEPFTAEGTISGFNALVGMWASRGGPAYAEAAARYRLT